MKSEELFEWKNRMGHRDDLNPLLQQKNIWIEFKNEQGNIYVEITEDRIQIDAQSDEVFPNVVVHAPEEVLNRIWSGEDRLLTLPNEKVQVKGRYRDLLLIESLFHLAKD